MDEEWVDVNRCVNDPSICLYAWIDGCMDGWMDGWMDGCTYILYLYIFTCYHILIIN